MHKLHGLINIYNSRGLSPKGKCTLRTKVKSIKMQPYMIYFQEEQISRYIKSFCCIKQHSGNSPKYGGSTLYHPNKSGSIGQATKILSKIKFLSIAPSGRCAFYGNLCSNAGIQRS